MPTSSEEDLISTIVESGISRPEAEHAVRRCGFAMVKQGYGALVGSALAMYFMGMTMTPVAFSYGTLAFTAGAGHALIKSPACEEVRQAVQFWSTAHF